MATGKKRTLDIDVTGLPADLVILLSAPDPGHLAQAVQAHQQAHAAYREARAVLDVTEVENGVSAGVLRRPDLRTRYSREALDAVHDASHKMTLASHEEDRQRKRLEAAAKEFVDRPSTRRYLGGLAADVADAYADALDGLAAAEQRALLLQRVVLRGGERGARQAALGLNEGEIRRVPADNYRTVQKLAQALRSNDEAGAA